MQLTLPAAPPPATLVPSVHLLHGDCLDMMSAIKVGSVGMVFADLPYGVTRNNWDVCLPLQALWTSLWVCCAPKAPIIMTATNPFAADLIASQRNKFRYDLVIQQTTPGGFLNAKRMPLRAHEMALVFYKKLPIYHPQRTPVAKAYSAKKSGPSDNYGQYKIITKVAGDLNRLPISVLQFTSQKRQSILHPTQKPVALLEWLIRTYTNEGDTVLDPVSGSATTAIAALRTGRNVICIEKDPDYFEVGRKRVAEEQARLGFPVTV